MWWGLWLSSNVFFTDMISSILILCFVGEPWNKNRSTTSAKTESERQNAKYCSGDLISKCSLNMILTKIDSILFACLWKRLNVPCLDDLSVVQDKCIEASIGSCRDLVRHLDPRRACGISNTSVFFIENKFLYLFRWSFDEMKLHIFSGYTPFEFWNIRIISRLRKNILCVFPCAYEWKIFMVSLFSAFRY